MTWSRASKNEWLRRKREQIQLARDNIARVRKMLETEDYEAWRHRKTIVVNGKAKLGPFLSDREMRAYLKEKLRGLKEHLERWKEPFDFEKEK